MHALAPCITAGIGNIAVARSIDLDSVESTVVGNIGLMGLLSLDDSIRNGFRKIDVNGRIEGDAGAEALADVVRRSVACSAVFVVITNGADGSVAG